MCKILVNLLDTKDDITRRQGLATSAYNKLEKAFKSRNITLKTKMRMFNGFVGSIFLYNSEQWTTTHMVNEEIDCIQRRFQRKILGTKWPNVINNKKLYEITKQKPWRENVRKRAMRWLGHLMRLDPETPARRALNEYTRKGKRPPGRPKETWLSIIRKSLRLNKIEVDFSNDETMIRDLENICADRKGWRNFIRNIKL